MPGSIGYLVKGSTLLPLLLFGLIFVPHISADYSQFRYDTQRTGAAPYKVDQDLTLEWTSENFGNLSSPPAVDSEGNTYLSTIHGLVAQDKNGHKKWTFSGGFIFGHPIIDNQHNLYFSSAGNSSCEALIYSIDQLGQQRWKYNLQPPNSLCGRNTPSQLSFSPDKSTLYFGTFAPLSSVIALNLDGVVKWQKSFDGFLPVIPTVAPDGTIYVGTSSRGLLYALTADGVIKWRRFTVNVSPAFAGAPSLDSSGNIYLTAGSSALSATLSFTPQGDQRWINTLPFNSIFTGLQTINDNRVYITYKKTLRAIDATSGTTLWEWVSPITTIENISMPVIDRDGNIYTASFDTLFIINPDGQTKKTIVIKKSLLQPIISQDNEIYIPNTFGLTGSLSKLSAPKLTKTPLLFIPGIGGSELKTNKAVNWSADNGHSGTYTRNYSAGEKIWVNEPEARALGNDDYFDILRMKGDGITPEASLTLTDDLFGAYTPTKDFFTSNGYQFNQDFFIFPYDWRKDIATTKDLLDQKINQIKQQTGSLKVDLVAHSMGGLVARNYIADPQKATNVKKLVTLGSPFLGSTEFLKALHYGTCITKDNLPQEPFCLGIPSSEVKDILHNMISGYELAPSQKYYSFYDGSDSDHGLPFWDERDIDNNGITQGLNYNQTKDLLTNLGHNTSLFSPAESFHNLDNNLSNTNGIETTLITGSGQPTLGQIIEKYKFNFAGIKISEKDQKNYNGDNTVPLFSSALEDPSKNLSLKGSVPGYYTKQTHNQLVTDGPALQLVKNILDDSNVLPSGVQTTPYNFSGKTLSVHSPVNIHVYDQLGNHTGPLSNGDYEANIPGSTYDTLDDAKFIFLPEDGIYQVKFEATDQGNFDFKIRTYENDSNTKTVLYDDIPLTQTTKAETLLNTIEPEPPVLNIDKEGDGNFESSIQATSTLTGNETSDLTPPQTNIIFSGTEGNNNWYKTDLLVTLSASDDNSGINKIEYSLDNGQTVQIYSQPFNITTEGLTKLKVKSTDNAGNEEPLQEREIKIDKTSPEAKALFNLQTQNIEFKGTDNLESVEVTEPQPGQVLLTDPAGNTTLLIVDPKNKPRKEKIVLKQISYNNSLPIIFPQNNFQVKTKLEKSTDKIIDFEQKIDLKGEEKLNAKYNHKTETTRIVEKQSGEKKIIIDKLGIVLLNLTTNQGTLDANY